MGRLIDIDSLKGCAIIRPTNHESIEHIKQCGDDVLNHNDIPTAYDVKKVIHKIDETLFEFGAGNDCTRCAFREVCDDGNDGCIETIAEVFRNTVRMGGAL